MKKAIAIELISFLFILLFVYASLIKLTDIEQFVAQLGQSPLLMPFATWTAWAIPSIELIVVILLIVPRLKLTGLIASFTLMTMFTVYIIIIMSFAEHVPCSCGGILGKMGWMEHLIFTIGFILLALTGIILLSNHKNERSLNQKVAVA